MYIHTFGRPGDPVILLLHPMGITGTALYDIFSKYIPDRNSYFVISPDQGGHGSGGSYLSKAEEVNHLVRWLHDNNCMHIHFLFGASMGAALAYELIKKPELTFDKVWLDGASFSDDAKLFCLFFTVAYRCLMRIARKKSEKVIGLLEKLYPRTFSEMIVDCCLKMDPNSAGMIFKACCDYGMIPMTEDIQKRLHIELDNGEKMQMRAISKYLPEADLKRNPNFGHCENMAKNTKDYVQRMCVWFSGGQIGSL